MREYANLVRQVIETGQSQDNERTGVGTLSVFDRYMQFSHLTCGLFPLLTIKKVHVRSVMAELVWFLMGQDNTRLLHTVGVTIWDEWAVTNEESIRLENMMGEPPMWVEPGDLGNIYGTQWRGTRNHSLKGVDQILNLVNEIKQNPQSRRLMVMAWNPEDLPTGNRDHDIINKKALLPPCHYGFQCYVVKQDGRSFLNLKWEQRSVDFSLGAPFNIASYAMLLLMLSVHCKVQPGLLSVSMGDVHIYKNHVDIMSDVISSRVPLPPPRYVLSQDFSDVCDYLFNPDRDCLRGDVDRFKWCVDVLTNTIQDYTSHPTVKLPVAV